jgi:hypothetical protein
MISQKLLVLLQNFSKTELRELDKFLQSSFHNENQDLVKLFKIIETQLQKSNRNDQENSNFEKKIVWKKVKGNTPYLDEQMRRISSDLTKKAYHFLAYNEFKKNPMDELIYLLPNINTPSLNKHFTGVNRQLDLIQKKSKLKNADFHYSKYKIKIQQYINVEKNTPDIPNFDFLEKADFHLDTYYIFNKLKIYCDSLVYQNMTATKPKIHLLPDFLLNIENSPYINEPCIKTYFYVASMMLKPDEETNFHKAKSFLEKNLECFTKHELNQIYIYLKNYCIITKINNGKSEYFSELFNIFKTLLEKEINFSNGFIGQQDYKNIITVGLHINEFDWTENFIQNYTIRLPRENQDNDLNYNLAKVYFHKKDYQKVIEQLREVEYQNLTYTMGGRLMLLKTYYELNELDALESLLDSYGIYLRRNKLISREVKQQLMNGIRFTRKLASLAPYNKSGIQKLKTQIINCKALAAKKWLLEKVEALE